MSEIITLDSFSIYEDVFIRKINNKNRWIQYDASDVNRASTIANDVFDREISSLWLVKSNEDFYGFVAAISSNRSPQNQNIDFIAITQKDLEKANVKYYKIPEGNCIAVKESHYNAQINQDQGIIICQSLINRNQEPQRCKKRQTQRILEYQQEKGCIAVTKASVCNYHLCS